MNPTAQPFTPDEERQYALFKRFVARYREEGPDAPVLAEGDSGPEGELTPGQYQRALQYQARTGCSWVAARAREILRY